MCPLIIGREVGIAGDWLRGLRRVDEQEIVTTILKPHASELYTAKGASTSSNLVSPAVPASLERYYSFILNTMKDKTLRRALLGKIKFFNEREESRISTITYPATPDHEEIKIEFRGDDGLIYALLLRIEALEKLLAKKK